MLRMLVLLSAQAFDIANFPGRTLSDHVHEVEGSEFECPALPLIWLSISYFPIARRRVCDSLPAESDVPIQPAMTPLSGNVSSRPTQQQHNVLA